MGREKNGSGESVGPKTGLKKARDCRKKKCPRNLFYREKHNSELQALRITEVLEKQKGGEKGRKGLGISRKVF